MVHFWQKWSKQWKYQTKIHKKSRNWTTKVWLCIFATRVVENCFQLHVLFVDEVSKQVSNPVKRTFLTLVTLWRKHIIQLVDITLRPPFNNFRALLPCQNRINPANVFYSMFLRWDSSGIGSNQQVVSTIVTFTFHSRELYCFQSLFLCKSCSSHKPSLSYDPTFIFVVFSPF